MNTNSLICVLGADTLIGSALVSSLARAGLNNLVSDLADRPEYVFVAAGRSGGILANQRFPADLCHKCAARGPPDRRKAVTLFGELVCLPKIRPATAVRWNADDRFA